MARGRTSSTITLLNFSGSSHELLMTGLLEPHESLPGRTEYLEIVRLVLGGTQWSRRPRKKNTGIDKVRAAVTRLTFETSGFVPTGIRSFLESRAGQVVPRPACAGVSSRSIPNDPRSQNRLPTKPTAPLALSSTERRDLQPRAHLRSPRRPRPCHPRPNKAATLTQLSCA